MTDTTVTVDYEIHADDSHSRGEIQLPDWAAGDPKMAVALYFFGERTSVGFITKAEVLPEWECAICGGGSNSRAAATSTGPASTTTESQGPEAEWADMPEREG